MKARPLSPEEQASAAKPGEEPDMKTVFLDRDGVINRRPPDHEYVCSWEDFEILEGVPQAIQALNRSGFRVVVVTNQRGVARGHLSEHKLKEIHQRMLAHLSELGAAVSGVYYCPHDDGECQCRKPGIGLLLTARRDMPEIDFASSYVVSDSLSDIELGRRLACRTVLITYQGPGALSLEAPAPDYIASSLLEAVEDYILRAEC